MGQYEVRPCRREDLPAVVDLLLAGGDVTPGVTAHQIRAYAARRLLRQPVGTPRHALAGHRRRRRPARRLRRRNSAPDAAGRRDADRRGRARQLRRAGGAGRKVNSFAALAMLKRLFAGPQDLTFTDTANEASRRLWEAPARSTRGTYSLDWFRLIKPATAILQMMETARGMPLPMSGVIAPGTRIADLGRRARCWRAWPVTRPSPSPSSRLRPRRCWPAAQRPRPPPDSRRRYTPKTWPGCSTAWSRPRRRDEPCASQLVVDGQGARSAPTSTSSSPGGVAQVLAARPRKAASTWCCRRWSPMRRGRALRC